MADRVARLQTRLPAYAHEQARGIIQSLLSAIEMRWSPSAMRQLISEVDSALEGHPLPDRWQRGLDALRQATERGDLPDDRLLATVVDAMELNTEQLTTLLGDGVPPAWAIIYAQRYAQVRQTQRVQAWASRIYNACARADFEQLQQLLGEPPPAVSPASRPRLQPHTPTELRQMADADIRWLWEGVIPTSALVLLAGREKGRGGKSTVTLGLLAHLLKGEPFLEHNTVPVRTLHLSEEPRTAIVQKLRAFGIDTPDLLLLTREDFTGGTRGALTRFQRDIEAIVEQHGVELVVCDTLQSFTDIRGEGENQVGTMLTAIAPLQALAARGCTVLVLHHHAKGTGEARGSTALTGAVDVVIHLTRVRGDHNPNRRVLAWEGRFGCGELLYEYDPDSHQFTCLGTSEQVEARAVQQRVMTVLQTADQPLTQAEIAAQANVPRQRVAEVLLRLLQQGKVARTGDGRKGNPYRYALSADFAVNSPCMTAESNFELTLGDSAELSAESSAELSPAADNSFLPSYTGVGSGKTAESAQGNGSAPESPTFRRDGDAPRLRACPQCGTSQVYPESDGGIFCYACRERFHTGMGTLASNSPPA